LLLFFFFCRGPSRQNLKLPPRQNLFSFCAPIFCFSQGINPGVEPRLLSEQMLGYVINSTQLQLHSRMERKLCQLFFLLLRAALTRRPMHDHIPVVEEEKTEDRATAATRMFKGHH
jgi:hypothetical protein